MKEGRKEAVPNQVEDSQFSGTIFHPLSVHLSLFSPISILVLLPRLSSSPSLSPGEVGRVRWGSQLDVLGQSLSRLQKSGWSKREWARQSFPGPSIVSCYYFFHSFSLLVLKYKLQSAILKLGFGVREIRAGHSFLPNSPQRRVLLISRTLCFSPPSSPSLSCSFSLRYLWRSVNRSVDEGH